MFSGTLEARSTTYADVELACEFFEILDPHRGAAVVATTCLAFECSETVLLWGAVRHDLTPVEFQEVRSPHNENETVASR
jgi:hypothetical protein